MTNYHVKVVDRSKPRDYYGGIVYEAIAGASVWFMSVQKMPVDTIGTTDSYGEVNLSSPYSFTSVRVSKSGFLDASSTLSRQPEGLVYATVLMMPAARPTQPTQPTQPAQSTQPSPSMNALGLVALLAIALGAVIVVGSLVKRKRRRG